MPVLKICFIINTCKCNEVSEIEQNLWKFRSGRDYIKSGGMRKEKETDDMGPKTGFQQIKMEGKGSQREKTSGWKTLLGNGENPGLIRL